LSEASRIEWTECTWNPVTGCTKLSSGCQNCYAERMTRRLQAMGTPRYADGFAVRTHEDALDIPVRWRKPRTVFVNSMSDLLHEDVPDSFIAKVFDTMVRCPQHTFQVLTKRAARLERIAPSLPWPHNVWMGVTVEDEASLGRVRCLASTPARVKFLSCEPLLGSLAGLQLDGIDWVIVGGESGPGARPMDPAWAIQVRDTCVDAGVPYFFKQWGGVRKKARGRVLDGRTWDELPDRPAVPTGRI